MSLNLCIVSHVLHKSMTDISVGWWH